MGAGSEKAAASESSAQAPAGSASARAKGSLATVLVALASNALIAVAKTVVAALTGSASLVAEAYHSWADTGNEVFLLLAERRSQRAPTTSHPLGYGRSAFVYAMLAGFGLFAVGSGLSISHGITSIGHPDEGAESFTIGYVVLAISAVLEGVSFVRARREAKEAASELGVPVGTYLVGTSRTTVRSVFFEDFSALIGLSIAGLGLALHQITGNPFYDSLGSILVGVLLGFVAIFLIRRNAEFIVGEPAQGDYRDSLLDVVAGHKGVAEVSMFYVEYVGPGQVFVAAAVNLKESLTLAQAARVIQDVEDTLDARPDVARSIVSLGSDQDPGVA